MTDTAQFLSPPGNFAVVRLPERHYPGIIVQGDTLAALVAQLGRMKSLLAAGDADELAAEIEEMEDQLSGALFYYEKICAEHSIS